MKQFIIYFSWSNDEHTTVVYYRTAARDEAKLKGKVVAITEVDTDKQPLPSPNYFDGQTIECVTVDGDQKKDSEVNPTLTRVVQMIDDL
jgi:hypothetical protein